MAQQVVDLLTSAPPTPASTIRQVVTSSKLRAAQEALNLATSLLESATTTIPASSKMRDVQDAVGRALDLLEPSTPSSSSTSTSWADAAYEEWGEDGEPSPPRGSSIYWPKEETTEENAAETPSSGGSEAEDERWLNDVPHVPHIPVLAGDDDDGEDSDSEDSEEEMMEVGAGVFTNRHPFFVALNAAVAARNRYYKSCLPRLPPMATLVEEDEDEQDDEQEEPQSAEEKVISSVDDAGSDYDGTDRQSPKKRKLSPEVTALSQDGLMEGEDEQEEQEQSADEEEQGFDVAESDCDGTDRQSPKKRKVCPEVTVSSQGCIF